MNSRGNWEISKLFRNSRGRKYPTAKEFWDENSEALGVSYSHYSSVENGTKFPDIGLTISVSRILKIDLRLACHTWAKDQMPDPETRAFFEPVPGKEVQGVPSNLHVQLDELYVFTEMQLPKLRSNPLAWDVLLFIMAFSKPKGVTLDEVASALSYDLADVEDAIDWLRNEGLVVAEKGALRTKHTFFHIPNTESFKQVRDSNFFHVSKDLIRKLDSKSLKDKEAYRTTFQRKLTRTQAQQVCAQIDDLIGHLGNMDEVGNDFYALTVAFGSRAKWSGKEGKRKGTSKSAETEATP